MNNEEKTIWKNCSSQILNTQKYLLSFIVSIGILFAGSNFHQYIYFAVIIPILFSLFSYYEIKTQTYELTNQRIIFSTGVLNKVHDEIELYRIKDHRLEEPFFLRIFDLGNVTIITSDQLNQTITLHAIYDAKQVKEALRLLVEERRSSRGVREIDTN